VPVFNKKSLVIAFLTFLLLLIFSKNYISGALQNPSISIHLVNIAKVVIPLKNLILIRDIDEKIVLLETKKSCVFCDLSQGDLNGLDLKGADLRYANLSGADLSNANLSGADLSNDIIRLLGQLDLSLKNTNLSGANLSGVDLRNKDLTGTNLTGVNLKNKDLNGANLSRADLSNFDLTGTTLTNVNLSGANLSGVDLRNKDLTGTNLTGVDLSNVDLTGSILNSKKIKVTVKKPSNLTWPASKEIQDLNVTRYDLDGDVQYLGTIEGLVFEYKNYDTKLVIDLQSDLGEDNIMDPASGILGLISQNGILYISYSSKDIDGVSSLKVDEYSMNFSKIRNIITINWQDPNFYGGALTLDSFGKLYLTIGDGDETGSEAQDLNSLLGKVIRLDVSKQKIEPEIIAYGLRQPWGAIIDQKDRMFIMQCGGSLVEAVYLMNDLYPAIPVNFGWPIFEGSIKKSDNTLSFNDIKTPIFETNKRPGCMTAGVYLEELESFLYGDFFGTIGLLKQQTQDDWYLVHEDKQDKESIWGFGYDKKLKKIFIAPNNIELEILLN